MNLFNFIDRGIQRTGGTEQDQVTERARKLWLDKLLADETRVWMNIAEADRSALSGMCVLLTLAGLAHAHDTRNADTPEIRVIRGAISAAEQCGKAGSVITADTARAFSASCNHARVILRGASLGAIQHAALYLDRVTK